MLTLFKSCYKDRSGISSVEFALIAPFMVMLFLGMIEISDGLLVKRKVTSTASTVADLVARAKAISDSDIDDVFSAAEAVMIPYDKNPVSVRVSSIAINLKGEAKVDWSDAQNTGALTKGNPYKLPSGIGEAGGSVIVAEISYTHKGITDFFLPIPKTYSDTFYLKPRRTLQIPRS